MKDPVFYGREAELKALQAAYESPKAEMVLIYGNRRMGKTALIQKFCKGKPTFFYTAKPWKAPFQLERLPRNAGRSLPRVARRDPGHRLPQRLHPAGGRYRGVPTPCAGTP